MYFLCSTGGVSLIFNCLLTSKNYRKVHILHRIHQHLYHVIMIMEKCYFHYSFTLLYVNVDGGALAIRNQKSKFSFICCNVIECVFLCSNFTYLNMNINRTSNEKNIATLSMVRNITKSCRRRFGMNLTNFKIRNSRNVRSTLNPELPSLMPKNC